MKIIHAWKDYSKHMLLFNISEPQSPCEDLTIRYIYIQDIENQNVTYVSVKEN